MILRTLLTIAAALVALTVAGIAYVRLTPMDAAEWHVDPAQAERTGRPNDYLIAEDGELPPISVPVPPTEALSRVDAVAMAEAGVTRLAGSPEAGLVTYVQRSRLVGYPDAISVSATPDGAGSLLRIYSRSRYGRSDLGVNRARIDRWRAAAGF